jgi:hypothetical protein
MIILLILRYAVDDSPLKSLMNLSCVLIRSFSFAWLGNAGHSARDPTTFKDYMQVTSAYNQRVISVCYQRMISACNQRV